MIRARDGSTSPRGRTRGRSSRSSQSALTTGSPPKEIHEATGVARGSVGPTLRRLAEHGLVRHKGQYWAAPAEDRVGAIASVTLAMDAVDERFGDDWYGRNPGWADDLPDLGGRSGGTTGEREDGAGDR